MTPDLTARELGTVLAALRMWQYAHDHEGRMDEQQVQAIRDIETDGGKHDRLASHEIDQLCQKLNTN